MSLLCALMPLAASAYDFEVDGLYFNKTNEGEVAIVKGDKQYSGDVVVPATITVDGVEYAVTAIGKQAFKYCGYLTSIVISEGVKTIEDEAFVTCTSLVSVEFPASLREIGQDAFYASSSLRSVQLPEGLERIGRGAFHYSGMEEIVIPSTVSKIDGGFISGSFMFAATSALSPVPWAGGRHRGWRGGRAFRGWFSRVRRVPRARCIWTRGRGLRRRRKFLRPC